MQFVTPKIEISILPSISDVAVVIFMHSDDLRML
jgi:hypothetical protein